MTSDITREAILDLLHEVARDAINHYEIPRSYESVDFAGVTDQIVALFTPAPDPNGDAVAWRRQVAEGLGYLIPETGEIAAAATVVTAASQWRQDSLDHQELVATQIGFTPPF